ncbi:zinc finger protein [Gigaspora margarita]|uniref:Zinc finger protein n=1 Tax=Gigaspora margarita TaxID=4874 RepID=A0A8H4AG37_GIGMA|nr:zinc finger protein [Gigaspora margarita]
MPPRTKRQKQIKPQNVTTIESQEGWTEDEPIEFRWTEDELIEFERVGKRLINEILKWYKDAAKNLRPVYTGNSRTTAWRQKKEKKVNEENAKGINKLETFFQPNSLILMTPQPIYQEPYMLTSLSLYHSPSIIPNSSLWLTENLHIRLEELNQRCSIGKSVKENSKIFTYDYLHFLSVRRFIQLLLEGRGNIDASD